jgi:hypothetical protein
MVGGERGIAQCGTGPGIDRELFRIATGYLKPKLNSKAKKSNIKQLTSIIHLRTLNWRRQRFER